MKKALSIVLALVMVFSCFAGLAVTSGAEELVDEQVAQQVEGYPEVEMAMSIVKEAVKFVKKVVVFVQKVTADDKQAPAEDVEEETYEICEAPVNQFCAVYNYAIQVKALAPIFSMVHNIIHFSNAA